MIAELKNFIESRYIPSDYPTLEFQRCKWAKERPLEGLEILDAAPVFGNTIAKYIPLIEAGADLSIGISDVMPRNEEVFAFLQHIGMRVITPDDKAEFDIVLDCAAAFSAIPARIGYVELTRSGVPAYAGFQKPVYIADSSLIKHIETALGTGEGYFRAMAQLGYTAWKNRTLVIFGNGKVGKGLATYGRKHEARVVVFDENAERATVVREIADAYAVVTATGVKGAVAQYTDELSKSAALLANMGVEDEYGDRMPADRVLEQKRPLNFILEEPTHMRYIETTMALHNFGATEILRQRDQRGLIEPSTALEQELLALVQKQGRITQEINTLIAELKPR